MLKRNKKNVLIGVCALAGVALTSVGFATWVVGVQNTKANTQYDVKVDDVESDTVYLTVGATKGSINIGESQGHKKAEGEIIGTKEGEGAQVVENAMQFSINDITLKVGNGVTAPTKLKIELQALEANNVVVEKVDSFNRPKNTYHYVEYSRTVDLVYESGNMVKDTSVVNDSYTTYKYTEKDANVFTDTLKWGDFFGTGNVSPVNYYNGLNVADGLTGDARFEKLLNASSKAHDEVKAMHTALNTATLTFLISVE